MSTTTETAPDSCPFCGAGVIIMEDGRECCSGNQWASFKCFTNWHRNYGDPRKLQSALCATGERVGLIFDREKLTEERDNLLARVKRLEEAGDALERDKQAFKKVLADLGVVGSMGFGSTVKWAQAKEAKP